MSPPQEQDPSLDSLDPFPGRLIAGNFRIGKLIGQGAMGNVYQAEQLSLGKAVAVKVLHPHLMDDEKLVLRFKREAKSASKLNHVNSVQIIDSGQDADGTLYIAMELLAGRDLAQVIRDEFPMPLPRVVRIMTQVMAALDEAHVHGVVHRDLKPSNIMLIERRGERDFVKVCDFGIAKATHTDDDDRQAMLTIQGLVCGTPEYMAPEQARAEPLDGRADLYSAAVILYQLVTGDIPFKAESAMGIVSRHLAEAPVPPSLCRPDLPIPKVMDEIVLRGMEKSRERRYATANAFRAALEGVVSGMPGQYTPVPPSVTVRASMPTAPAQTAVIPPAAAADRFGSTADLTTKRSTKRSTKRWRRAAPVAAAVVLAGVGAAVLVTRGGHLTAGGAVTSAGAMGASPTAAGPGAPPRAAPPTTPPAPTAEPPVEEAPAPAPPPPPASPPSARQRHHRPIGSSGPSPAHASQEAPSGALAARVPAPAAAVTVPPEAAPARGPREVLLEGEQLLGQGEVQDACSHGEEAKRMNPKLPAVYKFLGKCYMRAGRAGQADDNYKKYLELAPNASDAPFIKSMLK